MKITVERKQLKLWVGRLLRVKPGSSLPILSFLKFEAQDPAGRLLLSSMNLEIAQRVSCAATIEEEGSVLVPGTLFNAALGLMEEEEVVITTKGSQLKIACGSVSYEFPTLDPDEFPTMPNDIAEANLEVTLTGTQLLWLMGTVDFSICKDETRYALNGMLLERDFSIEEKVVQLRAVCTDGRRLSVATTASIEEPIKGQKDFAVVLPRHTATVIRQMGQDAGSDMVILRATALRIEVLTGAWRLSSSLNEVEFPKWRAVLPKLDDKKKLLLKVSSWTSALRSLMAVATDEAKLTISQGRLTLEGNQGRSENTLDFTDSASVTVNPDYLLEALENCPAELADFHAGDGSSALCFVAAHNGVAWKHVLMPMKTV